MGNNNGCGCISKLDISSLRINTGEEVQTVEESVQNFKDIVELLLKQERKVDPNNYITLLIEELKKEKVIKRNKKGKLYNIDIDNQNYYIEVYKSDNNIDLEKNPYYIKSIFGNKIYRVLSVTIYEGKVYVIYR